MADVRIYENKACVSAIVDNVDCCDCNLSLWQPAAPAGKPAPMARTDGCVGVFATYSLKDQPVRFGGFG